MGIIVGLRVETMCSSGVQHREDMAGDDGINIPGFLFHLKLDHFIFHSLTGSTFIDGLKLFGAT